MSEPIRLWANDGTHIDVYSPSEAMRLIEQGLKPFQPAPLTIEVPVPHLVDVPGGDGDVTIEFDTPEAERAFLQRVATARKPRKRATGGVL